MQHAILAKAPRTRADHALRERPRAVEVASPAKAAVVIDDFSEPHVEKMRGPALLAVWAGVIGGSWAVFGGIGYAIYSIF